MITCRELIDCLIDFVSGDLPSEKCAIVEQHLRKCQPCVAYLHSYQVTIKLTRQLPCEPPPQALMDRLRAALQEAGGGRQAT